MLPVRPLDLHLAVVSGVSNDKRTLSVSHPVVYGTAFPVVAGVFLTAGHVYESARSDAPIVALCHVQEDFQIRPFPVIDAEIVRGVDLAILRCPGLAKLMPLPVSFEDLTPLDYVQAEGFPHATDVTRLSIVSRAFAGHVVTRRESYDLSSQPPVYEVSFQSPKGLSGAPLCTVRGGALYCHGYMYAQVDFDSGNMRVGCAVASDALLSVDSRIVGGPLARIFGRDAVKLRPATPVRYSGPDVPMTGLDEGWPDDALSEPRR